MKKIKYIIFILFFFSNISFANENIKINIINGDNIDEQTIYSILDTYSEINDDLLKPSSRTFSRKEFGIPDDSFVFCSFNSHQKISYSAFNVEYVVVSNLTKFPLLSMAILFLNISSVFRFVK